MAKIARWLALAAGLAHAAGALVWWWVMPKGFPSAHLRFWAGEVAPWGIAMLGVAAFAGVIWRRAESFRVALLGLAGLWVAMAIGGRMIFPVTMAGIWIGPMLAGIALAALVPWRELRGHWPRGTALIVCGCGIGLLEARAQLSPSPATHPTHAVLDWPDVEQDGGLMPLSNGWFDSPSGDIGYQHRNLRVVVNPLLTFWSRSPDGCWTILARPRYRNGPQRTLRGWKRMGQSIVAEYLCDGREMLRIDPGESIRVDAFTELPRPVYSHLNALCHISVSGHHRLSISFSPRPELVLPVEPSDYPSGRPVQCAYLGSDGQFRIVRASSAEKGPFHELGRGPLARAEPLTITLYDEATAVCTVTLEDFAAQADVTNLSPTAGWGLPPNAIEFALVGDGAESEGHIFITLAGTSLGRGYDSVGHSPGVYRNRVRISAAEEK